MRQLFIHIGTHKTGTTSIQWYLNRHARKLKSYGTYVPQAGCPSKRSSGHHNIAWTLLGNERANPDWGGVRDLVAELNRADPVQAVISAEDLEFLVDRPEALASFEAELNAGGWAPVYLLFLRAPGPYAISLFQEFANQNISVPFPDYLESVLANGCYTPPGNCTLFVDFNAFVAHWRVAAKGDLRIYSYDAAAKGRGVIPTFISSLGLPARLSELRQRRINVAKSQISDEMRAGAQLINERFAASYQQQISTALNVAPVPAALLG